MSVLIPVHVLKALSMAKRPQANSNMYGPGGASMMEHLMTTALMNNGEEKGTTVEIVAKDGTGTPGQAVGTRNEHCVGWLLSLRCRYRCPTGSYGSKWD